MSYIIFNNLCYNNTPALTSNQKFILPDNPVYCECCVKMTRYPGKELKCCSDPLIKNPVMIQKNNCKSCSSR